MSVDDVFVDVVGLVVSCGGKRDEQWSRSGLWEGSTMFYSTVMTAYNEGRSLGGLEVRRVLHRYTKTGIGTIGC